MDVTTTSEQFPVILQGQASPRRPRPLRLLCASRGHVSPVLPHWKQNPAQPSLYQDTCLVGLWNQSHTVQWLSGLGGHHNRVRTQALHLSGANLGIPNLPSPHTPIDRGRRQFLVRLYGAIGLPDLTENIPITLPGPCPVDGAMVRHRDRYK